MQRRHLSRLWRIYAGAYVGKRDLYAGFWRLICFYRGGKIIYYCFVRSTVKRTMFALHPRGKVFSQVFFKKLAGLGRAHKKRRFLFPKLFLLRLLCQKKKRNCGGYVFIAGEENFFEKKLFFPRTPIFQKTYRKGKNYLLLFCALGLY